MGGCASKPQDFDILKGSPPTEDVVAPEKAEGEIVAQGTNNVDEIQNKVPLIDLSKEDDENSSSEQKTIVEATPVSVEAHEETTKIVEDKVENPIDELNDVKVEAHNETKEPTKEEQAEAKIDKSDISPLSEDKSTDAPLIATA